jgi:membrane fusion protein, heavy metal efflux system
MNQRTENVMRWPLIILVASALIGFGALATYVVMRRPATDASMANRAATSPVPAGAASASGGPSPSSPLADVSLTLSPQAIERAGIVVGRVESSAAGGGIRVPAVVEPNAYRSVGVTPIAAGRVTSVAAVLGQQVRRGQALAQVYSPDLAEAQSRYLASRAELEAHERELRRTERLVEIGSASRQELEKIHAEHAAAVTQVQSLRSQLTLLGMTPGQVDSLTSELSSSIAVPAPIDGVITERAANIGLNVDQATKLFTVVDLSTVWVVGNLYERDFARVRLGSPVTITSASYPTLALEGKISYADPQINPDTRTAQVRVEVPNPGRQLRLGMYADMQVREPSVTQRITVPRAAVQVIGDRSVVYLADSTAVGHFIEREVRLGAATGENVEVVSGVQPDDRIVTQGSFALRAERERLGLRPPSSSEQSRSLPSGTPATRIVVSEQGFEPARISLRAGVPARLTFIRTTDATCATEVVIPSLNIKRSLPLNQPVDIQFTPEKAGDVAFACGMGMFSGTLVVQ